ncbi:unnamed protein product, partial [Didymodactylos carnosus]
KHLKNLENKFEYDLMYKGINRQHFNLIPDLIHRAIIYCHCYELQLPLYESSLDLLEIIKQHTVISLSTSTGSGKSTLIPALLAADGYQKIYITQPRRLPCNLLSQHVNKKISDISGWSVAGSSYKIKRPITYLTDGLLREYLQSDELVIQRQIQNNNKSIIFFIDEVHERSVNIDLCLALLARQLSLYPQIHSRIKIILSSATLDPSIAGLFSKNKNNYKFYEFKAKAATTTLHSITEHENQTDENIFNLISNLNGAMNSQILCFVKSTYDVVQSIKLLSTLKNLKSYPLIQSQSAKEQQIIINSHSIFFSTTVAETSLTFPSLKYVIDTGIINMPVYDLETDTTILKESPAARSTIKQRKGRVGRTQNGEYYALYNSNTIIRDYPIPQICQTELSHIDFSLRRSSLKQGLNYLQQWLPNPPEQQSIDQAIKHLQKLNLLDIKQNLTDIGLKLTKLPDFGSLSMSKSVLAAIEQYNCGQDLIRIAAILSVLNTSSILKKISPQYKSIHGDFMTLLNIMNAIIEKKRNLPPNQFQDNTEMICAQLDLSSIAHILKRALARYTLFEQFFQLSNVYYHRSQMRSNQWELIAKALLTGFSDNIYLSMKELQGKAHHFTCYNVQTSDKEKFGMIDLASTLSRPISVTPVSLIIARDIRYSSAVRSMVILSFLGEIQSQWLMNQLQREILITDNEKNRFANGLLAQLKNQYTMVHIQIHNQSLILKGLASQVLPLELHILKQLLIKETFDLIPDNEKNENLLRHIKHLSTAIHIFHPLKWRWLAEKQVEITMRNNRHNIEIVINGRDANNKAVKEEFQSFIGWLKESVAVHLNTGVKPSMLEATNNQTTEIKARIEAVTDSKLEYIHLLPRLKGPNATRESRMEVVAWLAICKFDCKLEGGFVRDWIVGNYSFHPKTPPSSWLTYPAIASNNKIPILDKSIVPSDLDCHLPRKRYFDIEKFLDLLFKFEIETKVYRQDWRYILLFDENSKTGPFTMDLIEPHVVLTHDRIDFDVNNLYVKCDYTKELGQRINLEQLNCSLESIVENIHKKQFQLLKHDDYTITTRMQKMTERGWTKIGELNAFMPNPTAGYKYVLKQLPINSTLYKTIVQNIETKITNAKVTSVEEINNPNLSSAYAAMKKLIAEDCPGNNPNEQQLYHGTKLENAENILQRGFDDRHFSSGGLFGKKYLIYLSVNKSRLIMINDSTENNIIAEHPCKLNS